MPLKRLLARIIFYTGLFYLARPFLRNKLIVLMFHHPNEVNFTSQMNFLKKHYHVVSMQQVLDYYSKGKKLPPYSVLITFDDGYADIRDVVVPVTERLGIRPLVFIPTSFVGKRKLAWWDTVEYCLKHTEVKKIRIYDREFKVKSSINRMYYYILTHVDEKKRDEILKDVIKQTKVKVGKLGKEYEFLSWQDIRNLPIDIGSHTVTHPILSYTDSHKIKEELKESQDVLQKKTGKNISTFCYPNGDRYEYIDAMASEYYDLSFSCIPGFNTIYTDPMLIRRIGINVTDSLHVMAMKLIGVFMPLHWWRNYRRSLRVILATNYYFPQMGGVTIAVDNLRKNLIHSGVKVTVYPFSNTFRLIENMSGPLQGFIHKIFVVFYLVFGMFLVLWYKLLGQRVIVHGHSANFCAFFARLSQYVGATGIFTFHTDLRLSGLSLVDPKVNRIGFFNRLDGLSAVSSTLAQQVANAYKITKPIQTIYNGMGKQKIQKKTSRTILFSGNLIDIKGPMVLLEALRILHQKKVDYNAVMCGTGPLKDTLVTYVKKHKLNVEFKGSVPHSEMKEYYREAKILALPSYGEGLSLSVLEGLEYGCYIVASDVGGIPEIGFQTKGCGLLVPSGDYRKLASALQKGLEHKAACTWSAQKFDFELITRAYRQLYEEAYNRKVREKRAYEG